MFKVVVYDIYNNIRDWTVESREKGREYAKRIIMEGYWYLEGKREVFLPVWAVVKVVIMTEEEFKKKNFEGKE